MGIFSPRGVPDTASQMATESLDADVTQEAQIEQTEEQTAEDTNTQVEDQQVDDTQTQGEQTLDTGDATQTEEVPSLEADEQAKVDHETGETQEVDQQQGATQELTASRTSAKAFGLLRDSLTAQRVERRSADLRESIRDVRMVQSLSQVAEENNFSAPMVAAFQAIPGFSQIVQDFPGVDKFSVCLEPPTSINAVAGMESFSAASTTASDAMRTKTSELVSAFGDSLVNLGDTVATLRAQLNADQFALESSDLTEEVLATLPVTSLDDASLNQVLNQTQTYLSTVQAFDASTNEANPEKVVEDVQGMEMVISEVGPMMGLSMDKYGLRNADRDAVFEPTQGTFGDKGITAASVDLMINRAGSILDTLEQIALRKDELVDAANLAVESMPVALNTDDVTYGALDHVTLINSHTTFVSKLVTEGVAAVAMVLSTVDSILDVQTEIAE
jgi:hypothetical protein